MELEGGVQLNKKLNLRLEELAPEERILFERVGLTSSIETASTKILELLPVDRVDVAFFVGKKVIPETGDLGYARRNWIRITVDPSHKNGIEFIVEKRLPKTLAHELHHVARMRGVGYGKTLLEAIVTEGLADHFSDSLYPEPKSPWIDALSEVEIKTTWEKAKTLLNKKYNRAEWFFGKGSIPRWAGYTIGYRLVGDAIKKMGKTPQELVGVKATEIFEASGWREVAP